MLHRVKECVLEPCVFDSSEINEALHQAYRIYLSGHLEKPETVIAHLDIAPECGLSQYDTFTSDKPHCHKYNYEFNYVIAGQTKVLYLDTMEEFLVTEGGLFVVQPNQAYATKHQANTRIIFFKSPGGNDKELVDVPDELKQWLSAW